MGDRGRASPRVLAGGLAVFFVVTVDVLVGGPLTALDGVLSRWVHTTGLPGHGWRRPGQRELDQMVNFGDREVVGTILVVVLAVICWKARTLLPFLRLAVIAALTIGTVWGLKLAIARPAPAGVAFEDALRSYPSGHTATSVVLWGLLAAVVADYRPRSVSAPVVEVLSWLGPLLVMIGMLLRDYHWFSDLLAGAAVGVVLVQGERLALRHWRGARRGSRPADQLTAVPAPREAGDVAARADGAGARPEGAGARVDGAGAEPAGAQADGAQADGAQVASAQIASAQSVGAQPVGTDAGEAGAHPARDLPGTGRADARLGGG